MKAIVLAGGRGTRMGSLTEYVPKPMIDINGLPFLSHMLDRLIPVIRPIIFVVGYRGDKIRSFLTNTKYGYYCDPIIVEQEYQLGTGNAVELCSPYINPGESFLVMNGDSLFSYQDIKALIECSYSQAVTGMHSDTPEKYGVLQSTRRNSSYLKHIVEKPQTFVGDQVNVGLYKLDSGIFPCLKMIPESPRGEYELTDAINMLATDCPVYIYNLRDRWMDLGCPEDVIKISEYLYAKCA